MQDEINDLIREVSVERFAGQEQANIQRANDGFSHQLESRDQFLADLGMQSGGAVRVSLGLVTNFADVYRLAQFARTFLDTFPGESDLPPRLHC